MEAGAAPRFAATGARAARTSAAKARVAERKASQETRAAPTNGPEVRQAASTNGPEALRARGAAQRFARAARPGAGRQPEAERARWEAVGVHLGQGEEAAEQGHLPQESEALAPQQRARPPETSLEAQEPEAFQAASRASPRRDGPPREAPGPAALVPPRGRPASPHPLSRNRRPRPSPALHSRRTLPPPSAALPPRLLLLLLLRRPAPRRRPRRARPWASPDTRASRAERKECAQASFRVPGRRAIPQAPRLPARLPQAFLSCPPIHSCLRPALRAAPTAAHLRASAAGGCWPGASALARPRPSEQDPARTAAEEPSRPAPQSPSVEALRGDWARPVPQALRTGAAARSAGAELLPARGRRRSALWKDAPGASLADRAPAHRARRRRQRETALLESDREGLLDGAAALQRGRARGRRRTARSVGGWGRRGRRERLGRPRTARSGSVRAGVRRLSRRDRRRASSSPAQCRRARGLPGEVGTALLRSERADLTEREPARLEPMREPVREPARLESAREAAGSAAGRGPSAEAALRPRRSPSSLDGPQ